MASETACPDGIDEDATEPDRGFRRHASPVSILILGGFLLAALLGLFGGGRATVRTADVAVATLTVATPNVMRNGVFFETRIDAAAKRDLADATIAVTPSLWRDLTINTHVPAASDEEYKDGLFRFRYGPLKAGETLKVKIDGQVNPPLFAGTEGDVVLLDGETKLARVPLAIRVLP